MTQLRFLTIALFSLASASICPADVQLLQSSRGVYVRAYVNNQPPILQSMGTTALGPATLTAHSETSLFGWTGTMDITQASYVSEAEFEGDVHLALSSIGSNGQNSYFDAMAGDVFEAKFVIDSPTPYEFLAWGSVTDPLSVPDWTDAKFYIYGPNDWLEQFLVFDGDAGHYRRGVLQPGEYRLEVGSLGSMWYYDDTAEVDYHFRLTLPEPSTLTLLMVALPILRPYKTSKSRN